MYELWIKVCGDYASVKCQSISAARVIWDMLACGHETSDVQNAQARP